MRFHCTCVVILLSRVISPHPWVGQLVQWGLSLILSSPFESFLCVGGDVAAAVSAMFLLSNALV